MGCGRGKFLVLVLRDDAVALAAYMQRGVDEGRVDDVQAREGEDVWDARYGGRCDARVLVAL